MRKVVVVTGAKSGIGLALCERLLSHNDQIRLCLACRNLQRAEAARSALLSSHPSADVRVLLVDVGKVTSVVQAAKELKERYKKVDYLYLSSGNMPNPQFSLRGFIKGLFSRSMLSQTLIMAVDERSGDLLFQKMLELEKEILQKCISEHRNS